MKKCLFKNCTSYARGKTDYCRRHGGGKRCIEPDCKASARSKTEYCVRHGGGVRCPNCIDWIDSRSGCNKYDGYCATCFKKIFPADKRSVKIREKGPETKVRNFLNEIYIGFIHDHPIYTGNCKCSHRRRVDHRKLIGNTMLCIETDERQHSNYDKIDEEIRYDDLMMVFSGKWIFIRFNPDSYKNSKGIRSNPKIEKRFTALQEEIDRQIKIIEKEENEDMLKIVKLYYDS